MNYVKNLITTMGTLCKLLHLLLTALFIKISSYTPFKARIFSTLYPMCAIPINMPNIAPETACIKL